MKIVLSTLNVNVNHLPLALGYLKGEVQGDPYLSERCEAVLKPFPNQAQSDTILWGLAQEKPDLVGFSCYLWNITRILQLAKSLKSLFPRMKIVIGGPESSHRHREILHSHPYVDLAVRGEGEETLKELLRALLDGRGAQGEDPLKWGGSLRGGDALKGIPGITYRKGEEVVVNPDRPPLENLDAVPSPYFMRIFPVDENTFACVETQRGCPFGCYFCDYRKSFLKTRFFSLDRAFQDLELLLHSKVRRIYLMDPTFNVNRKRMREICEFIARHNHTGIQFHAEIRADLVDEEEADLFYKANLRTLEVGLQSGNQRILREIGRPCNLKRLEHGIHLLHRCGIKVEIQLIAGLPGESWEGLLSSVRYALSLNPAMLSIFTLLVLPGTPYYKDPEKFGLLFNPDPPYEVLRTNKMDFMEIRRGKMLSNALTIFRGIFPKTCHLLAEVMAVDLVDLYFVFERWLGSSSDLLLEDSVAIARECQALFPTFAKEMGSKFMGDGRRTWIMAKREWEEFLTPEPTLA